MVEDFKKMLQEWMQNDSGFFKEREWMLSLRESIECGCRLVYYVTMNVPVITVGWMSQRKK
jgi:hypothetical protein